MAYDLVGRRPVEDGDSTRQVRDLPRIGLAEPLAGIRRWFMLAR